MVSRIKKVEVKGKKRGEEKENGSKRYGKPEKKVKWKDGIRVRGCVGKLQKKKKKENLIIALGNEKIFNFC